MYIDREELMDALEEQHYYVMQDPEISKKMKWYEAVLFGKVKDILDRMPAADVVEVRKELKKAVKLLNKEYEKAERAPFVLNPLAYALYQTWKIMGRRSNHE